MVLESKSLIRFGLLTVLVNFLLMLVKILTGVVGHSQALIADGIESATDIFVSLITWSGFHISQKPPDSKHPFGHGKLESLAGLFSGLVLIIAAAAIAVQSVQDILSPGPPPEWFTLPVLLVVVAVKEILSRRILSLANREDSRALEGDAWHHRSDAITSAAAAIGISIALVGGAVWAMAEDLAALLACAIIFANGSRIIARSLHENLDGRVDDGLTRFLRNEALQVEGVLDIDKCLARKSGTHYFAELHVEVDPATPVVTGHLIGHRVKEHLMARQPRLLDVVVHLEPHGPAPPDPATGALTDKG